MTSYTLAAKVVVLAVQAVLLLVQNYLAPGGYLCPVATDIDTVMSNDGTYDVVIIGAGTAGLALAHRIAKTNSSITILLIDEAEGCSPYESLMPGDFTLLPNSTYDRKMNIVNDSLSCQNIGSGIITAGKMLGGSSGLEHMIYVSPFASDYDSWATAANDSSWSFPDFAKYFAIGENVQDEGVLKQNATLHGTCGPQVMSKQESSLLTSTINALVEMGSTYVSDATGPCNVNWPLLNIGNNCSRMRQSGVNSYLSKLINDDQVTLLTGATATKLIMKNMTATGVQVNVSGVSYNITVSKYVVVTMGAIKTPQMLMLSGIGDEEQLTNNNIPVVISNSDVGSNLMDHLGIMMAYCMENSTASTVTADPSKWPVPVITNYAGPSCTGTNITDQAIILRFPPKSSGFLQLCGTVFKYSNDICDAMYKCSETKALLVVILNLLNPKSRGSASLQSASMTDDPLVTLNLMNDSSDLDLLAERAMEFDKIRKTSVFEEIGVEMCDVGVCSGQSKDTLDYWKCYVVAMSSTMWHYSGTCAMGTVVDSNMFVKETTNLMVADASIFPTITSGNIISTVRAVAEKGAAILLKLLA